MSKDLRHLYAEALANAECEKQPHCVDCMADAVMTVRDEEVAQLREENATLLLGANPSRVAAGKRIVDSLTRLVRIERDDARADRDRWRERAKKAEYELEQWHAAYGESALPATMARLSKAEATLARVRRLVGVYEVNARAADGVAARNWFELFAEELQGALDGPHPEEETDAGH